MRVSKVEELKFKLGFGNCFAVDREGRSGGVAILWKNKYNFRVINYSMNYINMEVVDSSKGAWRLTGFYGIPHRSQRRQSWNIIRSLSSMSPLPWCIIGDFNDILSVEDKQGSVDHPAWLFRGFREVVTE